jgi:hypothetical protein
MSEGLLKKREPKIDRRGFLRGSGLAAAAALIGFAASPAAFDQDPARPASPAPEDDPEHSEPPENAADSEDSEHREHSDTETADNSSGETGASEETKVDAEGRPYRTCPQCGFNMYKQDRTWTCENCGYSYVE